MSSSRHLSTVTTVPRPLDHVFAFFSMPENLGRITPPELAFELTSTDTRMRKGLRIDYKIRPILGLPARWQTLITGYEQPHRFVDIQLRGPYRQWEHEHTFTPLGGATQVQDDVTYQLPLGRLGDLFHDRLVRTALERIWGYRAWAIRQIFAPIESNPDPMRVGVAGGTGFVGGAITAELHRRGHRALALSRGGEAARGPLPDEVQIRTADVRDPSTLVEPMQGLDALVIALAFPNLPMESPRLGHTFMEVDAAGTERLVAAAAAAGVRHVIYISGAGASPEAREVWFRAKARAEAAVRASGMTFTIIRPTWIYGPRDVALNRFLGFARALPLVPMTNAGRQLLAPVFIGDVAALVADALTDPAAADQTFELGGPETLPMRDIIRRALRVAGLGRPLLPGPTPLIKAGAVPLSLLPTPPLTPDAVDFINAPATVDVVPLLERMPRRLTPLDEGLGSYLAPGANGDIRFGEAGTS
ncbi:MAG TPA: NAD(P)H-binding protein [Candidatus Limnocylindria bacterium]|nr:NAD(P)H-binding protein [Candidatus Limnocylindria bacterium]